MTLDELKSKHGATVSLTFNGRKSDAVISSRDLRNVTIHTIIPNLIKEDWHNPRVYILSEKDIDGLRSTTDGNVLSSIVIKTEDLL